MATKDDKPVIPLPKTLVGELPTAAEIVKHLDAIHKLTPKLDRELTKAKKAGAIKYARAFTVLHRLVDSTVDDKLGELSKIFERVKVIELPELFDQAGVKNVPLAEGYRIGVSYTLRASVRKDERAKAYEWVRKHHPDIISETINASTLSGLARELRTGNQELPDELFNVADVPSASVTKI